jgi:hypothetical protein
MKDLFVPALIQLVEECEEDEATWAESHDDEDGTGNTAYSAGCSSIERLALDLKSGFTLGAFTPLLEANVTS